jgi:hypothetical protein
METSASQYVLWMEFLEWETNAFDKTCYYLAQIAAEVRRSYVKRGVIVQIEDFILKFISKRVEEKTPVSMDKQTSANRAKQFFFALTGLTGNAKKKGKRP